MTLRPHLHLLIPSSSSSVLLEARLYLPQVHPSEGLSNLVSTSASTNSLLRLSDLTSAVQDELKQLGVQRVVTAAHPWGKLGGNMLDPVLSHHLIDAVFSSEAGRCTHLVPDTSTAVITYNVRGVGASQGSSAWVTPGSDPGDFSAVEQWALALFGSPELPVLTACRLGYSWGCIAAVLAPPPSSIHEYHRIHSIMLVSPPLSFLPAVTYFSGSFDTTLRGLMSPEVDKPGQGTASPRSQIGGPQAVKIWTMFGDNDQFTGVQRYRTWAKGLEGVRAMEVEGDHFWRGDQQGRELCEWLTKWLIHQPER